MPRISAATVAENRQQRLAALIAAGRALVARGRPFTMAELATEVGLSRSSVYEYYTSTADLVGDVLVSELQSWAGDLDSQLPTDGSPRARIRSWMTSILHTAIDGRHAILRDAAAVDLPPGRRAELAGLHAALILPLVQALTGIAVDPAQSAQFVWGVTQAAMSRIEAGLADPEPEVADAIDFVERALDLDSE